MNTNTKNPQKSTLSNGDEEEEEEENHDCLYAMQLASSSVLPMVLKSAIELDLFSIINKAGPGTGSFLSPSQIAAQIPNNNNPDSHILLDQILRLLASHSILTCSTHHPNTKQLDDDRAPNRLYGLAPVSKYFIPNQDGVSLASLFLVVQDKRMINMWHEMKDAVLDGGIPFNRAHGMNAIDYVQKDPKYFDLFKTSMTDYNLMFMNKVLNIYRGFQDLKSLVDVGGGNGTILSLIVSKYPTIKAINFDLPQVIEKAYPYLGIEHIPGDMFDTIPKADTIFMKWMLHSWDDEHCIKILKNCYKALPENGKAIIVDLVIPEIPETSIGARSLLQFDLYTMNMNPGGKERTEREFKSLAIAAGFYGIRIACSAFNFSLVEFYKDNSMK